ncbi:hypothetical protein DFP72DRAFT_506826 [Ephemerocybe angulata]|uniref:Uncharacterized protein n=1 Tax=Ephemerocybe angulata TaxID=980116 RepID=A0A8H6HR92_9AGAR|nr:hypothetical protein DFP72DRAFT_506826 [Tulosesus angulatus]
MSRISSEKHTEPPKNCTQQASPFIAFLALQLPRTPRSIHFPSSLPQLTVLSRHAGPSTPTSGLPPPHLHHAPHDHPRAPHNALPPDHPSTTTHARTRARSGRRDRDLSAGVAFIARTNPRLRPFTFIPAVYPISLPFSLSFLARPLTLPPLSFEFRRDEHGLPLNIAEREHSKMVWPWVWGSRAGRLYTYSPIPPLRARV